MKHLDKGSCQEWWCVILYLLPNQEEVPFGLVGLFSLLIGLVVGLAIWSTTQDPKVLVVKRPFIAGAVFWMIASVGYYMLLELPPPNSNFWYCFQKVGMYLTFGYTTGFLGYLLAGLLVLVPRKILALFVGRD